FLGQYCPQVQIVDEASGVAEGFRKINEHQPDLVLLDIQMEDGTGFDLLEKIRQPSFSVIFTTAFDNFAVKAFKYAAVDYLLKPIDPDELVEAVGKVTRNKSGNNERIDHLLDLRNNNKLDRITLSSQDSFTVVKLDHILRLESDSNYTHFFLTNKEKITVPRSLKEFEELLPGDRFFRTHQSHIINLAYVKKFVKEEGGYVVMEDGSEVLVARRRKDEFIHVLTGKAGE
ncbi:MAG: response regulator transcription factor, partial [Flavobacteriales bacterium]|nr:response regulator transcription factor [Flavobacteriales bacterium]